MRPADGSANRTSRPRPQQLSRHRHQKFHRTLDVADPSRESDPALVSDLSSLGFEAAREDLDFNARRNEGDVLQLAHYQRMLESMGLACRDGRSRGSSAPTRLVVWHDLDAPIWRTPSLSANQAAHHHGAL